MYESSLSIGRVKRLVGNLVVQYDVYRKSNLEVSLHCQARISDPSPIQHTGNVLIRISNVNYLRGASAVDNVHLFMTDMKNYFANSRLTE